MAKLATGVLLFAVAISLAVPYASAHFVHNRGLRLAVYPRQMLVFWSEGPQSVQLVLFMAPPFYFVPDLDHFDTVTLTVTLKPVLLQGDGQPIQVLDNTATWTNVVIEEDEYGAILGAYLLHTVTFDINSESAGGYYMLLLNGEARTGDVVFRGFSQTGVTFRPGHIPIQLGQ